MAARDLKSDVDALQQSVTALRGDFGKLFGQVGSTAQHAVAAGRSTVSERVQQLGAQLDTGKHTLRKEISAQPISKFGLAFVAGIVVAMLVVR